MLASIETGASADFLRRSNPGGFDLVVTDYAMPDMTGLELAAELLKINPHIRIIMCSGFNEPIPMERIKQTGIRDFSPNPSTRMNSSASRGRRWMTSRDEKEV